MHHGDAHVISGLWPLLILTGILFGYLLAAFRHGHNRGRWSRWRSVSFASGIFLLMIALSPPLAKIAHADFRWHMAQHLLIGMFAPLGLVLAAPLTLALRSLPTRVVQGTVRFLHSEFIIWLSHPLSALLLNIGGMYFLYLAPLYALSLAHTGVHYLVHLHFLLAGYLFVWAIAGPDPAPRRPGMAMRVTVLLLSIASHALLAKLMYIYLFPTELSANAAEIKAGAKLMYYGGDFAEFLLAIALFYYWYQRRTRKRRRAPSAAVRRLESENNYSA